MNGAVQGLATTTASTPVKNEPDRPGRDARLWPAPIQLMPKCTTPDSDSPSASIT